MAETASLTPLQDKKAALETLYKKQQYTLFLNRCEAFASDLRAFQRMATQSAALHEVLAELHAAVEPDLCRKLDANGYAAIQRQAEILEQRIHNRMAMDFVNERNAFRSKVRAYHAKVTPLAKAWRQTCEELRAQLEAQGDRLRGCQADPRVQRWAAKDIALHAQRWSELRAKLEAGDFADVEQGLASWRQTLDAILAAVAQVEAKEIRRQYLLECFRDKLAELGFAAQSVRFEQPENPASATILKAAMADEKVINVRIPQQENEPVMYAVEGFSLIRQTRQGMLSNTCDEAERQIEEIHARLKADGIEASPLRWEDQPPKDLEKEAKQLLDAADRGRLQYGEE